ncbi:MAG: FAD:protein FMN transferase [Syntrophomonadaceae bacterium]|nr:FAD:protein FMN transferase [Bacillota bacterium]
MRKTLFPYIIAAVMLAVLAAGLHARGGMEKVTRAEFLMDTLVQSTVFAREASQGQHALEAAYQEMFRLERLLDRHHPGSEVTQINRAAGREPVPVSPETLLIIEQALEYAVLTGGAFDITVGPLLRLWRFTDAGGRVPSAESLQAAAALVDFRQVVADRQAGSVFLRKNGAEIDLGGIAKGFVVDRAVEVLLRSGISSASVDAGGDIRLLGAKPDGSPWRIGVRHPRERRGIIAVLELEGCAVVTSGDYERYFLYGEVRYHHLLDPATGRPAGGLVSVTVVAPEATTADALSTAVFVLGRERGLALIESLPGIEALLVTAELEVVYSSGLAGKVTVSP